MVTKEIILSNEQQNFIDHALNGENILVNACIGSGKTTVIQKIYKRLKNKGKLVLYLTYNKILKEDARNKIKETMRQVINNYHGFAWYVLDKEGIECSPGDLIQTYIKYKDELSIPKFDVLIVDEYQDIDQEISAMLEHIKSKNSEMQIIAVGDMDQKIYDWTRLNVDIFIKKFLGKYIELKFTRCFRLSQELALRLGKIWNKDIIGVNSICIVEERDLYEIVDILSTYRPKDILCLGMRGGSITDVANDLEDKYPNKFNKNNTYISIRDNDGGDKYFKSSTAIFTTYDSSKGMERDLCVVFDWTEDYWRTRLKKDDARWEIIRNIFCVAASRGKKRIIFVKYDDKQVLTDNIIKHDIKIKGNNLSYSVSTMFDFKYKEDIVELYDMLEIFGLKQNDNTSIDVESHDGLIDLSPCIGIMQEVTYFNQYDIDSSIEWYRLLYNGDKKNYDIDKDSSIERKVLYMTSLETNQDRYMKQVNVPFMSKNKLNDIHRRLNSVLSKDENVQIKCNYTNSVDKAIVNINGRADVVKDNIVYELKFVQHLSYEHYLQCACYMIMLNVKDGIIWNIKNNTMYRITISDRDKFMKKVVSTITKGRINIS